jgi:GT2 family glycosyltransferase/glycosyltransferase involved in cell wall biosynthesis
MDSGPYRRISRPGRHGSGSGGRGSGGGGWLANPRKLGTVALAAVAVALVLLQASTAVWRQGGGEEGAARSSSSSSNASPLTGAHRQQQPSSSSPLSSPVSFLRGRLAATPPAPSPEQAAPLQPPPPPERWPRGVPRSIKAARWEAAATSAPAGGRGPSSSGAAAAAAAAAMGAVPPAACTGTAASLPSVRPEFCEPLFCLRSARDPSVYVDLAFAAFTRLDFESDAEAEAACGLPLRGQEGPEPPAWWLQQQGEQEQRRRGGGGASSGGAAASSPSSSSASSSSAATWQPPPPEVSFLLTVHNKPQMVVETVLELFRTSREARSVEFVVVDDGSTEDMGELALVGSVIERHFRVPFRMVRNEASVGFGAANTQAAKLARGEWLALINSDALVTRGWLAALLSAVRDGDDAPGSRGVGLAGPLFLNSTGLVMEAGGVVWADASAANYGRREVARHEHLYSRRADYLSAACVLAKRDVFLSAEIGGFDERYGHGYWEDTDLAMAYSNAGYEVKYVPAAVVLHDEGGSLSAQKQALMDSNRLKFQDKWRARLEKHHCPSGTPLALAADRGAGKGRLLWVDDIVPEPDRDSGSIRTLNALRLLIGNGFRVSYQPTAGGRDPRYMVAARNLGVDVLPLLPADQWKLRADGGAAAAAARAAASGGSAAAAASSSSSSNACLYDVIVVARFYVYERAAAALRAACPGTPVVFDTVDVHFLREARMALSAEAAAAARLAARREASAAAARDIGGNGATANDPSVIVAPGAITPARGTGGSASSSAAAAAAAATSAATWNFDHTDPLAVVSWLDGNSPAAAAARRTRDREIALVRASTVTVVVSEVEMPVLRHYAPGARLAVVSNVHDVEAIEGEEEDDEEEVVGGGGGGSGIGGGSTSQRTADEVAATIAGSRRGSSSSSAASETWMSEAAAKQQQQQQGSDATATTTTTTTTTPAIAPLLPTPAPVPHQHHEGRACHERSGVLFVGNFNHLPNQQAVRTLLDDVLPAVADVLPAEERASLVLHIVGSNRAPDAALSGARVTTIFHGWLSDAHLRLLYGSVKVVVAPLLSGAGVKGKINQAMLFGVPVVATPVAAEGMHLLDGQNALVAASPREFAGRVLRAYTDCALWERLAEGGRANIRDFYSMEAAERGLLRVFEEAGVPAPGKLGPKEQTCEVVAAARPTAALAAGAAAAVQQQQQQPAAAAAQAQQQPTHAQPAVLPAVAAAAKAVVVPSATAATPSAAKAAAAAATAAAAAPAASASSSSSSAGEAAAKPAVAVQQT